jgi:hypothetical protein
MRQLEEAVTAALLDAQVKARVLFAEIERQCLIRTDLEGWEINESIYGVRSHGRLPFVLVGGTPLGFLVLALIHAITPVGPPPEAVPSTTNFAMVTRN